MDTRDFPLSSTTKRAILSAIFDHDPDPDTYSEIPVSSEGYFYYYRKVVEGSEAYSPIETHRDIVKLISLFKRYDGTRSSIETEIGKSLLEHELDDRNDIIEESISLAVRLLLMVPTGSLPSAGRSITVSGETKLSWKEGTIKDLVNNEIMRQNSMKESVKLEKIFNAQNLERIAGVEIRWTSNLADHLRMRDDDSAVEVFHHASFLRFHQSCHIPLPDWQVKTLRTQTCTIFPPAFVDETLRTLALLLPEHDESVEDWFSLQQTKFCKRRKMPLDPFARDCGQLKVEERQIDKFEYWHDRLVILKQVFDEAEPSNIRQWWHDRRKRVQWYTFWVAALVLGLTIVFGLIQCVEGALQVYLAAGRSF